MDYEKTMTRQEYLVICDVCSSLNIALAALDPKHNVGFVNAQESARELVLKSYKLVDYIAIQAGKSDPDIEKCATDQELSELEDVIKEWYKE